LGLLDPQPLSVKSIVDRLEYAQPTISEHLGVLTRVGLVTPEQHGRERHYKLHAEELNPIAQWLTSYRFWAAKFDALGALLEAEG
jgi:DNA-binding transcriptional ArsR family regulator